MPVLRDACGNYRISATVAKVFTNYVKPTSAAGKKTVTWPIATAGRTTFFHRADLPLSADRAAVESQKTSSVKNRGKKKHRHKLQSDSCAYSCVYRVGAEVPHTNHQRAGKRRCCWVSTLAFERISITDFSNLSGLKCSVDLPKDSVDWRRIHTVSDYGILDYLV